MIRPLSFLAASLLLAGCPGGGPFGNGLGEVTAVIVVKQADNSSCSATLTNGKDQTNLTVKGLKLCGGELTELHADRSDGASAALSAMVSQNQAWAGVVPGVVSGAICEAISAFTGKPCMPTAPIKPPAPAPSPDGGLVTAPPS